ncbi:tRNA lysidine(34) synthetase TilS [Sediminicola luteus]|uniref:tRNA(Ile)-lysidine synthase n=2 Tax=Sediminicola luteus TaxID=319238 RepID=A0A2A4G7W6_9FLAO|nr:tRNA lysidine(34) synthetase TilS [Sediminicola luteus]
MLPEFKEHIESHFPEILSHPTMVAISGGMDSVVLTHLLIQLDIKPSLAHCNFQLRGEESDADAEFVSELAEKWNLQLYSKTFETKQIKAENRGSTQMIARDLRYHWFNELIDQGKSTYLLTAHHLDDNIETFLIHLSRGTGIQGLLGIPERNHPILRPLLPFSREEILRYAKNNQLAWREDSSNASDDYLRNRIRHHISPQLKELHPSFDPNFNRTIRQLTQEKQLAQIEIDRARASCFTSDGDGYKIEIEKLQALTPLAAYLYHFFEPFGFSQFGAIEKMLNGLSGKEIRSHSHRLIKDRTHLLLHPLETIDKTCYEIEAGTTHLQHPIGLQFEKVDQMKEKQAGVLYIDADCLQYPLTLRKKKEGDVFYPQGMRGKKKLSKYFKDEKMDTLTKENQWLLCSQDQIVWVVGKRGDERFKITPTTQNIIKVTLKT